MQRFLIEAHLKHTTPKKTALQQARKLLGRLLDRAKFQQTLPRRI